MSKTGFRGVYEHSWGGTYFAQISAQGRREHLGSFATKESAAQAYDQAALRLHGDDAVLNFPLLVSATRHGEAEEEQGPQEAPDDEDEREPARAEPVAEADPWITLDVPAHALVQHDGHHD